MTDYPPEFNDDFEGFSGPATDFEDGALYPVTLTKLTRKVVTGPFGTGPAIVWTFTTEEGGTIEGMTSEATGPKSKARPWLEALVGKARVKEITTRIIQPSELVGRECQVLVGMNNDGYPRVEAVLPLGNQPAPREATPAPRDAAPLPEPQPEFDDLPF